MNIIELYYFDKYDTINQLIDIDIHYEAPELCSFFTINCSLYNTICIALQLHQ